MCNPFWTDKLSLVVSQSPEIESYFTIFYETFVKFITILCSFRFATSHDGFNESSAGVKLSRKTNNEEVFKVVASKICERYQ